MFTINSEEFGEIEVNTIQSPTDENFYRWKHEKASGGIDDPGQVSRQSLVQLILEDIKECSLQEHLICWNKV